MKPNRDPFALKAVGIGKRYRIGRPRASTIYERASRALGGRRSKSSEDPASIVWALRDISFEIMPGQVLGIIGRNGSGKSTLLRILARTTAPTEGYAVTYGRVAALLSVGTGFHPDLSGRDNIKLSGSILGMSRAEIAQAEPAIIDFAEIDRFLDTPVKYYSSGMYLRLAFSVSVHLAAEIMLIDEILAVGDAAFQRKCQQRIREVTSGGRTVLYISHSMGTIASLCQNVIVLDGGRMRFWGPAKDGIDLYTRDILKLAA